MELLELLIAGPIAYLIIMGLIKARNADLMQRYNEAEKRASILLGQNKRSEAIAVMETANSDLRKFYIRKVMGFKI